MCEEKGFKGAKNLREYFNKPKKPKKPHRKFTDEEYKRIEKIARDENERVTKAAESWKEANQSSPKPVNKMKEDRQVKTILKKAKRGVRRLADQFNRDPETKKTGKSISHSHVYNILTQKGLTPKGEKAGKEDRKDKKKKLHRRSIPFREFQMDTYQQAIAGSQVAFIAAIIDIFNSSPVIIEEDVKKWGSKPSSKLVLEALKALRKKIAKGKIKIKMDNGKEFKNSRVEKYCDDEDIKIIWNKKGEPWKNGFVERWFRSAKYEYIPLLFIQTKDELHRFIRFLMAHYTLDRPHQGLDNFTPGEKLGEWFIEQGKPEIKNESSKKDPDILHRIGATFRHLKELFQIRAKGYPPTFPPAIPLNIG